MLELGATFYRMGKYDEALHEFKKVLLIDPANRSAQKYVNDIFAKDAVAPAAPAAAPIAEALPPAPAAVKPPAPEPPKAVTPAEPPQAALREKAMEQALREKGPPAAPVKEEKALKPAQETDKEKPSGERPAVLSGEFRLGMGATKNSFIWKDANADQVGVPREKNWRYLWGSQRENTYDKKIYDRLTLHLNTNFDSPLNGFAEMIIDPWTFIGKNNVTIRRPSNGDMVDIKLKYWSADNSTINETYRTNKGEMVDLKQIKVTDGKTTATSLSIKPNNALFGNTWDPMDIKREYRPLRKVWTEYKQDELNLKVFPISDQYEALTSDDPLRLSNNHIYWEESPWLDEYEPSRTFDKTGQPVKKGRWTRSMSYFTRDSSDDYPHRLTFLRGASFKMSQPAYSLEATAAAPMALWDDYQNADSIDFAARLKVPWRDLLQLGFTSTAKLGLQKGTLEARNYTEGLDAKYSLSDRANIYGQIAQSYTKVREAKNFNTEFDGFGAKLGARYEVGKEGYKEGFFKAGVSAAYMGDYFYPGLSNYRYTRRDDPTWVKHIYFTPLKDADAATVWGDGMDRSRAVVEVDLGFAGLGESLVSDFKYRNVRDDRMKKYVESVLRSETTYKATPRFTAKLLAYYKDLPQTVAKYDPLIYTKTMYSLTDYFDDDNGHPENANVLDNKNPSIGAFALGGKYDLLEEVLSLEGVYEFTNDQPDFPRGLLNDLSVSTESVNGELYDKIIPFLYDNKFFDLPPYSYYDIAKMRLVYTPAQEWKFVLGYVYNANKHAAGIDDNINHAAFEAAYMPSPKWSFWLKYIYSRTIDLNKQNQLQTSEYFDSHHNVFFGMDMKLSKDDVLSFLYGEFVGYNDPYQESNWSLSALDTQHIFRLTYRRKF